MDKISIVVAVYNAEKTLKKCVDSLLQQTYENIEIILIDDCSQDYSLKICQEYSQQYEKVFLFAHEKNLGVSQTRNHGLDVASGEYLGFVDSDDCVEPNYVEELYLATKESDSLSICGFVYHDEYNHQKPEIYIWSGGNQLVSLSEAFKLYDEMYLTGMCYKLYDNRIIKEHAVRFDTTVSIGEDIRFTLEYLKANKASQVYALALPLYHYNKISNQNLMSDYTVNGIERARTSLMMVKEIAEQYTDDADYQYRIRIEKLKRTMIYLIFRNKEITYKERVLMIKEIDPDYNKKALFNDWILLLKEKIKAKLPFM